MPIIRFDWLGRQLSRTKAAQGYLGIILLAINAISLVSMAFGIRARYSLIALPALLLLTLLSGYYLDRNGVISSDAIKGIEMQYRYVTIQEMRSFAYFTMIAGILAPDKAQELKNETERFIERWKDV